MSLLGLLGGLAHANLAAGAAIAAVALLRRPVRRAFGAQAAYLLWIAPVLAGLAALVPPFAVLGASVAAPLAAPVVLDAVEVASGAVAGAVSAAPRLPVVLAAVWVAGAAVVASLLLWRQARYVARLGRLTPLAPQLFRAECAGSGPAVVGALRPRIVTPADFEARFAAPEREVILAHEQAHLSAGDARVNSLAAVLLCVCWFNPLAHVAARLMRVDQELACDAAVLRRFPKARRLYAEVLLKTQLAGQPLPFGCHWPAASEHPLKARIQMLKAPLPAPARRFTGVVAVALLSGLGAATAWAAQPGQPRLSSPAPLATVIQLAAASTDAPPTKPAPAKARPAPSGPPIPPPTAPREVPAPATDLPPRQAPVMPDWMLKPRGEDVAQFYPPAAAAANQRGMATLGCRVATDGRLQQCRVEREMPEGAGFGEAAMKLSESFQMKPLDRNGVPTAGQFVRIPIKFDLPAAEGAPLPPLPADVRDKVHDIAPRRIGPDYRTARGPDQPPVKRWLAPTPGLPLPPLPQDVRDRLPPEIWAAR